MDWLSKKIKNDEEDIKNKEDVSPIKIKKAKRGEAVRTNVALRLDVATLGSDHFYHFKTTNLSSVGMFVGAEELSALPFEEKKTVVKGILYLEEFQEYKLGDMTKIEFLGKIIRLVHNKTQDAVTTGFGIKIVEISKKSNQVLEELININNSLISMDKQSMSA